MARQRRTARANNSGRTAGQRRRAATTIDGDSVFFPEPDDQRHQSWQMGNGNGIPEAKEHRSSHRAEEERSKGVARG
ncbi:hypothetical protein ACLOJK_009082 [Asimina triloba]